MREIAPGLFHWSTFHEPIGHPVSSYYLQPAGLVVDPKLPDGGLDALPGEPRQIVLTIGLHHRDAGRFAEAFDIPIRASRAGAERLEGRLEVAPFDDGEEIAPGVTAIVIGHIAPDECTLHIAEGEGALTFADGLVNQRGLGFVPDHLIGDDAEGVKRGLRQAYAGLLSRRFDHLLFAHGEPLVGGGRAALQAFVDDQARG